MNLVPSTRLLISRGRRRFRLVLMRTPKLGIVYRYKERKSGQSAKKCKPEEGAQRIL